MNSDTFFAICLIYSGVFGTMFILYIVAIIIPFSRLKPDQPGNPEDFEWHFVVPCRDEEAVIGDTILYLTEFFPSAHVWVIDDDSEDSTAAIVTAAGERNTRVHLVQRRRPNARTGKAHALNYAWKQILDFMGPDADLSRSILTVVDADGRPSENLLEVSSGPNLFGARGVAAVQVEVRMSNRSIRRPFPESDWYKNLVARTFVRMQDIEFRGPISAIQTSRKYTRTVNVGGNGQLARMSALLEISDDDGPWRGALLEDFELGLHLLLSGWRNAYTASAWVDQEALYSLPRYITQRARWVQGTMQCIRYFPSLWKSRSVKNAGALEISYFLIQPWVQLLGTLFYPIPIFFLISTLAEDPKRTAMYLSGGGWLVLIGLVVFTFAQFGVWGPIYRHRSEPKASALTGIGWGLSYVPYIYLSYAVVWKAFVQFVRRQNGWAKTVRNGEAASDAVLVARLK
ncbi:glycosyltransferase family 2 protein [Mycetocola saprophilus]|uniref:glycosyltransferase family 2 protein n=1 Tax=Mycetocola saprophilus TaxID=76636 RepID=UPI000A59BE41|nr:glycosyltransferase family 2 protein [Mycetocola saprophilus]